MTWPVSLMKTLRPYLRGTCHRALLRLRNWLKRVIYSPLQ
jgi:hypothetical protein